jgi:hypothetical protein
MAPTRQRRGRRRNVLVPLIERDDNEETDTEPQKERARAQ